MPRISNVGGSSSGSSGTVTSVSVTSANGISGTVATATTTPAITLSLGAITPSAVQVSGLTASQILSTDVSKNLTSLDTATYPSLTELSYVKGVTSAIQTQINSKGSGTVTAVSVASANGFAGTSSGGATPALTLTTSITGVLKGNGTAISAATAGTDYVVGSTGLSGGQTIAGGTLTTQNLTLRGNAADTTTGKVDITTSTASTTTTTGALTVAGGVGVAGKINTLDLAVTNTITGSISGNAATVTGASITAGKTLTVTDSATIATNAITLAGGEVITFSATNALSLLTTGTTSVTLPTSGTLVNSAVATLSSLTSVGTITTGGLGAGATIGGVTMSLGSDAVGDIYAATTSNVLSRIAAVATGQVLISKGTTTLPAWSPSPTVSNELYTNNAITASANAATVPVTSRVSTVTNNSAATLTITITTTNAIDGQMLIVRILDFSAVAQTITWVNTENSTVTAPTTSNGSTTLPLTVGFMYNSGTSKWRCVASA